MSVTTCCTSVASSILNEEYPDSCVSCFAPIIVAGKPTSHFCCTEVNNRLCRPLITDWDYSDARGADREMHPLCDPSQHRYVHLLVRRHYRETQPLVRGMLRKCEYFLNCEVGKHLRLYGADGQRLHPPKSRNHSLLSAKQIRNHYYEHGREDIAKLKQRWHESIINGHSNRHDKVMEFDLQGMINEIALVKYLQSQGQRLVDIPRSMRNADALPIDGPQIHLRVSAAVNDLHDNGGSAAFVIGDTSAMQVLAREMTNRLLRSSSGIRNGAACAIIALPLVSVMKTTNESVLTDIREALLQNDQVFPLVAHHLEDNEDQEDRIQFHNQLVLNLIDGLKQRDNSRENPHQAGGELWAETEDHFLPAADKKFLPWISAPDCHKDPSELSILLGVWNFEKYCEVGLASGKRWITETSLEACLRCAEEKMMLDLSKAHIRGKRETTTSSMRPARHEWMLTLHMQLNLNCYVFTHQSVYI